MPTVTLREAKTPEYYAQQNRRLFIGYSKDRSIATRDALVSLNAPLVKKIAGDFARSHPSLYGYGYDDFCQIASLKLIGLIDSFDPEQGCPFANYAYKHLAGAIRHFIRDGVASVRSPRKGDRNIVVSVDKWDWLALPAASQVDDKVAVVRLAVERLPRRDRQLLEMVYSKELTYKQISEILSCSPITVSRQVQRLHRRLRPSLTDCFD